MYELYKCIWHINWTKQRTYKYTSITNMPSQSAQKDLESLPSADIKMLTGCSEMNLLRWLCVCS